MKIRNGFVSNSSSSSFIVTIPDNFKITDKMSDKIFDSCDSYYKKKLKKEDIKGIIESFIEDGYVNSEEGRHKYSVIETLYSKYLKDFMITSIEGGSDNPSEYQLLTINKMKKLIKKSEKYES